MRLRRSRHVSAALMRPVLGAKPRRSQVRQYDAILKEITRIVESPVGEDPRREWRLHELLRTMATIWPG